MGVGELAPTHFGFSIFDFGLGSDRVKEIASKQFSDSYTDSPKATPRTIIQKRKWLRLFAISIAFVICGTRSEAQQQAKVSKIGWLAVRPASAAFAIESFQREFGKLV